MLSGVDCGRGRKSEIRRMIKVKPGKNPIKETKDRGTIAGERFSVPQGIGQALLS